MLLDHCFTMYIPRTAKLMGIRQDAIREFSMIAGGCTISEAQGTYVMADGSMADGPVSLIQVRYHNSDVLSKLIKVMLTLETRMFEAGEEAVASQLDGIMTIRANPDKWMEQNFGEDGLHESA